MKKPFYWISASIVFLVLGVFAYLALNYHTSSEGALKDLNKKTEGEVLTLSDNTKALIIEEDGSISVAYSSIFYPFGWYKDFDIKSTKLNINDIGENTTIPYTVTTEREVLSFGLIKNGRVEYTISGSKSNLDLDQSSTKVFSILDYLGNPKFKNVKLWYNFSSLEQDSINNRFFFLDKNKEFVQVDKTAFSKK